MFASNNSPGPQSSDIISSLPTGAISITLQAMREKKELEKQTITDQSFNAWPTKEGDKESSDSSHKPIIMKGRKYVIKESGYKKKSSTRKGPRPSVTAAQT